MSRALSVIRPARKVSARAFRSMGGWLIFNLAIVLLIPPSAQAADPDLGEAIRACERFDYDEALRLLEALSNEPTASAERRAKIHLRLGIVRFTLGDRKAADLDFLTALGLDPEIALPEDTSPKIVARFVELRAAVAKTAPTPSPEIEAAPGAPPGYDDNTPVPLTEAAEPHPAEPGRLWTWIAIGAGGAALATGVVLGILADNAGREFDDARWVDDAMGVIERASTYASVANVCFITAGLVLAGALVLFFFEPDWSAVAASSGSGAVWHF